MAYTILLVDDDKTFCEEFSDAFYEYNIIKAFNTSEALRILKKPNEVDLIILDENLPNNIKGSMIIKEIKKLKPNDPLIMLTGHSSTGSAVRALRGNADDYLVKPMDIAKTKEVVDRLLSNYRKKKIGNAKGVTAKIQRVMLFLDKNADKIVSLNDAARVAALSPKYLSRVFKKETGTNFNQYYLSVKLKKADELLKKTDCSIEQISDKLGYLNPESFIRIYKKYKGKNPTDARKNNTFTTPKKTLDKKEKL